jgi:hypothetical protein
MSYRFISEVCSLQDAGERQGAENRERRGVHTKPNKQAKQASQGDSVNEDLALF